MVLCYSATESARDGQRWADGAWVPDAAAKEHAVSVALDRLAGWLLSTSDADLAGMLLAAGATERRHAHSMSTRLEAPVSPPRAPDGLRIEPLSSMQVDRHALALGELNYLAYPPEHPDALDTDRAGAVSQVRAIARGEILGPMAPESRIGVLDRRIVGACLVVERPGEPPFGGTWVIDLFRDPRIAVGGIGGALLAASMRAAREASLPGLSLVVSHDNQHARRLYTRLGFSDVEESWTLTLPSR